MEVLKWKTSQITAKQAKRILHPELSFGLKEKKKGIHFCKLPNTPNLPERTSCNTRI